MLNTSPSMFQQYNQNKDNVVEFVPLEQKKQHAREIVRNIAQTIFERFGCGSSFNDDCIKNFGEMYDPANFKIGLLNFQPTKSIFSFLLSIHTGDFLRIGNSCTFSTDDSGLLLNIEVAYSFVERYKSDLIASKLFIVFDSNFVVKKINYGRFNQAKELLIDVNKTQDMLCTVDEETMFIELFLNARNRDVQDLFPSFYVEGAYTFDMNEIESNMTIARMLIV